jgi:hypothetical protein
MISIKLNNNISCDYICHKIQRLIESSSITGSVDDYVLQIDIKTITDAPVVVPKIEYKDNEIDTTNP